MQSMASFFLHCPDRAEAMSDSTSEVQHDAAAPACHEGVSEQKLALTDGAAQTFSCSACDMHCSVLALPLILPLPCARPSSCAHSGTNDPLPEGIVLDALTRPPIALLF
jgi:hypothetical protein